LFFVGFKGSNFNCVASTSTRRGSTPSLPFREQRVLESRSSFFPTTAEMAAVSVVFEFNACVSFIARGERA
jgi:hypothetical protein